jgi:hypothetical protein
MTGENRSLNALKHGIFARDALLTSGLRPENAAEFESLLAGFHERAAPVGALEETLVDLLIAVAWRWRRVIRFESSAILSELTEAAGSFKVWESHRDDSAFYGVSLHPKPRKDTPADSAERDARLQARLSIAVLPSGVQILKIQRYEAHLSRQFFRLLRQLERHQFARIHACPMPMKTTEERQS